MIARIIFSAAAFAASWSAASAQIPSSVPLPPIPNTLEEGFAINSAICSDGTLVEYRINEAADVARGMRDGEIHTMMREVGIEPPHYVSGQDTVIVEPHQLTVLRGEEQRLTCPREPEAPVAGTIWGAVTKFDRMALPRGTQMTVTLVSREKDGKKAVAKELATAEIQTTGNQAPFHFLLNYDAALVSPEGNYALVARITDEKGTALYQSKEPAPVLTENEAQPPLMLIVQSVPQP